MTKLLRAPGIYKISNTQTECVYVGSAVKLSDRVQRHRGELQRGIHANARLQNSFNKYGESVFTFVALEYVADKKDLIAREQYYIDLFGSSAKPNFNICQIAGSNLGIKASEETRSKQSAAHKGKRHSPEVVAKVAAANRGKKRSPDVCAAISESRKGHVMPDNVREAIRKAHLGSKRSPETRAKMSAAKKGRSFSDEHRKNLSIAMQGNTATKGKSIHTAESRKRLSDNAKANDYATRLHRANQLALQAAAAKEQ